MAASSSRTCEHRLVRRRPQGISKLAEVPYVVVRRATGLQKLLAADERTQALVLLAARGTAVEMGPQPRDRGVGIGARELELDVAVEHGDQLRAEEE